MNGIRNDQPVKQGEREAKELREQNKYGEEPKGLRTD